MVGKGAAWAYRGIHRHFCVVHEVNARDAKSVASGSAKPFRCLWAAGSCNAWIQAGLPGWRRIVEWAQS